MVEVEGAERVKRSGGFADLIVREIVSRGPSRQLLLAAESHEPLTWQHRYILLHAHWRLNDGDLVRAQGRELMPRNAVRGERTFATGAFLGRCSTAGTWVAEYLIF